MHSTCIEWIKMKDTKLKVSILTYIKYQITLSLRYTVIMYDYHYNIIINNTIRIVLPYNLIFLDVKTL